MRISSAAHALASLQSEGQTSPRASQARASQTGATPTSADDLDAAPGTRAYTLKMLLERQFGAHFGDDASAAAEAVSADTTAVGTVAQGTADLPVAAKGSQSDDFDFSALSSGDHLSLSSLQASSVQITEVTAESLAFSAQVDGRNVQVSATRVTVTSLRVDSVTVKEQDPLVLDMAGDGIHLRPLQDGVSFDVDGDGGVETTGFIQGDDALLVLDPGGDGAITGRDLVGAQPGSGGGFAELAAMDDNADGVVDAADAAYSRLRVFQDLNGDGQASADELRDLASAGVASLAVSAYQAAESSGGQRITETGQFNRSDGTTGQAADVLFQFQEA
jgi:hypothetical protein